MSTSLMETFDRGTIYQRFESNLESLSGSFARGLSLTTDKHGDVILNFPDAMVQFIPGRANAINLMKCTRIELETLLATICDNVDQGLYK